MKEEAKVPRSSMLIVPTYKALLGMGGSGSNDDILDAVISIMGLNDDQINQSHLGSTSQTELGYQLAWARTYLKNYGVITNTRQSFWVVQAEYLKETELDPKTVLKASKNKEQSKRTDIESTESQEDDADYPEENKFWRTRLENIIKKMDPYGFERLCKRLLGECGFEGVKVTKKSGDNGIDGFGRLRIGGIVSFDVAFQCKRYGNTKVGAEEIRDFRGSLTSNIEKCIFITTSVFTPAAKEEANKSGAIHVDLIDGEKLIDMLAQYEIGLKKVDTYDIDEEYFEKI